MTNTGHRLHGLTQIRIAYAIFVGQEITQLARKIQVEDILCDFVLFRG